MNETTKLDAAIAKVTAGVKRLAKGERNSHGGYNFAGIDDFLEMTGKLCGDAGLNVLMDEDEFEIIPEFFSTKSGKVAGLRMRFAIWLRCQGEKDGPYRRSIIVPANMGSQAFGAAQSYVEKQFLRATFQIPTGDKGEDLDAHDTGTIQRGPANDEAFDLHPEPARGEKLEGKHQSKAKLQAVMREFVENLRTAETSEQVEGLIDMYGEDLAQCRRYLPGWWEGNGTPEGRGVQGNIEDARGRVASTNEDSQLSIMIRSMKEIQTQPALAAWMAANEPAVEALDDKDGRTFQTAVDLHESGLAIVATASA